MEIIQNTTIKNMYHTGFTRDIASIQEITIHGTAGGSKAEDLISWMEGGERAEAYKKAIALFHFAIGRNGKIIQLIDLDKWVYHSESSRADAKTIGIELLNPDYQNKDAYLKSQYDSLFWLIFDHLLIDVPKINIIGGHAWRALYYSGIHDKKCPGNFDWDLLESELTKRKFGFTEIKPGGHYTFKKLEV